MIIVTTNKIQSSNLKNKKEDFPGGPVTKICTPNAEGLSSIPGQGTRSHMLQCRSDKTLQSKKQITCIKENEKTQLRIGLGGGIKDDCLSF